MKKQAIIFGIVTMVSMIVATIGHAVNPAICVAIKPMSWPFLALIAMVGYKAVKSPVVGGARRAPRKEK